MIEQELLFLGLLRESPRHGYEIKTKIKDILSIFAGIDLKSIYYPLKILEKRGLVIRHAAKKDKRPQRFIYSLTPKGESYFQVLLQKSLLDFKRPQFSLDLSLYFLQYLKPQVCRRRLRARMAVLAKLARELKQMLASPGQGRPLSIARILEHNLQMVESEVKFLHKLIQTL
jgi:DNA-binding PadR family transcriptional regulator